MKEVEKIEVEHRLDLEDQHNYKSFSFEFNDNVIFAEFLGKGNYSDGAWIDLTNNKSKTGFTIKIKLINNELKMCIDAYGGLKETEYRSYNEWMNLQKLQNAVKLIKNL